VRKFVNPDNKHARYKVGGYEHMPSHNACIRDQAGLLSGISHFFIYFHIAVLLKPTRLPTSALFHSHSCRVSSRISRESFFPEEVLFLGKEGALETRG